MLGIVVLNYNNSEATQRCLESLHRHCCGFVLCVVDNASSWEDYDRLKAVLKAYPEAHLIRSEANEGYARGNNLGLQWLEGQQDVDAALILNNDTLITEDFITELYSYLMSHKGCGVAFPLVKTPSGEIDPACMRRSKTWRDLILQATRLKVSRREFINKDELTGPDGKWKVDSDGAILTQVPPGSCMMLRTDVFKSVGWLDPNTFLYFEEHILSEKLKKTGLGCALIPSRSIIHTGAATTSRLNSKAVHSHWRDSYLYYLENFTSMPRILVGLLSFRTYLGLRFRR